MKNYIIVGNGTAAAGCIEGIREYDKKGRITVISKEKYAAYCRPLISYYLEGKTNPAKMKYRPDDFYEKNDCRVIYERSAQSVDAKKKVVTLDNGEELKYDSLCIAAGSSPFVPPMEGLEKVKEKYSFMTLDDAFALEKALEGKKKKVLIVGAGLIGLKCAEGIYERCESITVCDLADRVLSSIMDEESAKLMQHVMEEKGVKFLLSDSAAKFEEHKAHIKSGKTVDFDVLVLAVGVRAETGLVKDAGGKCTRGITVDAHMKTSLKNVYAAGDCTESTDMTDGKVKVMAIMPNAYMQGFCAGNNMAGKSVAFDNAIPMNSIGFFGLHAMTAGNHFAKEDGGSSYVEKRENGVKRLYMKDGYLTGFVLIGDIQRTGIYTNLIRNHIPLKDIDFESVKKSPNLFAFGRTYREEKFTKPV